MVERALHGVNLSGWFTLESWVTPEIFAASGALDEPQLISALGRHDYHEIVREHRANFITEDDFSRIAARGFNAVRIAVPWYVFGTDGPEPGPYLGCIEKIDEALEWAEEIGLNVVFALRINPGAETLEGSSIHTLADLRTYRERALDVVERLAKRYASRMGFFGLALADDVYPQVRHGLSLTDGVPAHVLRNYYRDGYELVRAAAGDDVAVILPDGGRPEILQHFMAQKHYRNVWIDCHLTSRGVSLDASGPKGVRTLIERNRRHLKKARKTGLPVMVGKWSSSLPFSDSLMTPEGRVALERIYAAEQIGLYEDCPAWFFQTWKTSGRLASWDARVALATFERGMLS